MVATGTFTKVAPLYVPVPPLPGTDPVTAFTKMLAPGKPVSFRPPPKSVMYATRLVAACAGRAGAAAARVATRATPDSASSLGQASRHPLDRVIAHPLRWRRVAAARITRRQIGRAHV